MIMKGLNYHDGTTHGLNALSTEWTDAFKSGTVLPITARKSDFSIQSRPS
jgi:hypothetical protein